LFGHFFLAFLKYRQFKKMDNLKEFFMQQAIDLSIENIEQGGGPFGAIIVKDGKLVAKGVNRVTATNDPTAHAEVNAIREASKALKTFNLKGCEIYTSCEPCPMCLGAIYWARIDKIYYGNTKADAKAIGFDDSFIYDELEKTLEKRIISTTQLMPLQAKIAFKKWSDMDGKTEY
jgi:guanine deaminase